MTRGDIVVAALPGDTGKPRPAIVLRADRFAAHHRVTLLPLTSEVRDEPFLRVDVAPSATTVCVCRRRRWWIGARVCRLAVLAG